MSSVAAFVPKAFLSVLLVASALPAQNADSTSQPADQQASPADQQSSQADQATPPAESSTAAPADAAAPATAGVSKIRIVRLSDVKGVVQLDRNIGRGFEPVMANMPIVEKARLRTDQGAAEVEFEDNSTVRLAPDSEVAFPQLERLASGTTASSVQVLKGTVYVSMVKTKGNEFSLLFGSQKIELQPSTHVRLQLGDNQAKLAVLEGDLRIEGPSGTQDISKKKTVTFQMQAQSQPEVAKDVTEEPFDTWDKQSAEYHARTASFNGSNGSPAYGINDMSYYGSFADVGGCGSMWRPYFVSADWSPFSNGAYAYYPGAGYSWVSPYPWGWTPYHTGSWSYCNGAGWGWMPGGSWYGLNNLAMLNNGSGLYRAGTSGGGGVGPAPTHPPRIGEPTMTAVNLKPLVRSGLASRDSFEFRKDSAGMGIPRDLGKLDKLSRQTVEKGTAHTEIYMSAPAMSDRNGRPMNTMAPVSVHRGPAPSSSMESSSGTYSGGPGRPSGGPSPSYSSSSHSAPAATSAPAAPSGGSRH
jgi:ferric-dicitrate binding protein FerR (iron transport regulator)